MAIAIKSIPVLKGKAAASFVAKATKNYSQKKSSVDFSSQTTKAERILAKAKM